MPCPQAICTLDITGHYSSLAPQTATFLLTQEHLKTHIDVGKTLLTTRAIETTLGW